MGMQKILHSDVKVGFCGHKLKKNFAIEVKKIKVSILEWEWTWGTALGFCGHKLMWLCSTGEVKLWGDSHLQYNNISIYPFFDNYDVTVGLVPQIGRHEAVALRLLAALERWSCADIKFLKVSQNHEWGQLKVWERLVVLLSLSSAYIYPSSPTAITRSNNWVHSDGTWMDKDNKKNASCFRNFLDYVSKIVLSWLSIVCRSHWQRRARSSWNKKLRNYWHPLGLCGVYLLNILIRMGSRCCTTIYRKMWKGFQG